GGGAGRDDVPYRRGRRRGARRRVGGRSRSRGQGSGRVTERDERRGPGDPPGPLAFPRWSSLPRDGIHREAGEVVAVTGAVRLRDLLRLVADGPLPVLRKAPNE